MRSYLHQDRYDELKERFFSHLNPMLPCDELSDQCCEEFDEWLAMFQDEDRLPSEWQIKNFAIDIALGFMKKEISTLMDGTND